MSFSIPKKRKAQDELEISERSEKPDLAQAIVMMGESLSKGMTALSHPPALEMLLKENKMILLSLQEKLDQSLAQNNALLKYLMKQ